MHRPGYLDYIGVKRFNEQGEVCGEHRFLGLFTSTAYSAKPSEIPLLRRKTANVISRTGIPPGGHTGKTLLDHYRFAPGTPEAYALSSEDFAALAKSYGKLGGLDRIATILKSIRAERGDRVMFLDGGDTWQNSYTALQSQGQDMVDCMALLEPDAMTGHWEFTLGTDRVNELVDNLGFPFLAQNMRDTEWDEPAFKASAMFERGGVTIAESEASCVVYGMPRAAVRRGGASLVLPLEEIAGLLATLSS